MNKIILSVLLIPLIPLLAQTKIDTTNSITDGKKSNLQIIPDTRFEIPDKMGLFDRNFSVPLNLKIYQKVILNDYIAPYNYSREELETGMSDEELHSFEKNRLQFRRSLSDIYGEDFINIKSMLTALGITREQLISIVALLKLFLM